MKHECWSNWGLKHGKHFTFNDIFTKPKLQLVTMKLTFLGPCLDKLPSLTVTPLANSTVSICKRSTTLYLQVNLNWSEMFFFDIFATTALVEYIKLIHFTQCSISKPSENFRKPLIFWLFQGVWKWNIGLKWVKIFDKQNIIKIIFYKRNIKWRHSKTFSISSG